MSRLPIVRIHNQDTGTTTDYYVDKRLNEIRNTADPTDAEPIPDGAVDFWYKWGWIKKEELI